MRWHGRMLLSVSVWSRKTLDDHTGEQVEAGRRRDLPLPALAARACVFSEQTPSVKFKFSSDC